ncbi:MAG: hypothetical protein D6771_05720, partial [Zetaproteobacteria bacterium]
RFPEGEARLVEARRVAPEVFERIPELAAAWAKVLARRDPQQAMRWIERFLLRFPDAREVAELRLLRADLLRSRNPRLALAAYAKLAADFPETNAGRLARLRQWMLEARHLRDAEAIRRYIQRIDAWGARFQLSPVEDEAHWDLARLWARIARPEKATDPALKHAWLAAQGSEATVRAKARAWAKRRFADIVQHALDGGDDSTIAQLVRAYPTLMPTPQKAPRLVVRIADALRRVGRWEEAERWIRQVLRAHPEGPAADEARLVLARLFLDRGQAEQAPRLLRWAERMADPARHAEIAVVAASLFVRVGAHSQALAQLAAVPVDLLSASGKRLYWETRAEAEEALHHWREAAASWENAFGAGAARAWLWSADAWLEAGAPHRARQVLARVPKAQRDRAWRYHWAQALAETGDLRAAEQSWAEVAQGDDAYAQAARLMLSVIRASKLVQGARR